MSKNIHIIWENNSLTSHQWNLSQVCSCSKNQRIVDNKYSLPCGWVLLWTIYRNNPLQLGVFNTYLDAKNIHYIHLLKWKSCRFLFQDYDHPEKIISTRPSYLHIFWLNVISSSLCSVPLSVHFCLLNNICSLSSFKLMAKITSTSQILPHP